MLLFSPKTGEEKEVHRVLNGLGLCWCWFRLFIIKLTQKKQNLPENDFNVVPRRKEKAAPLLSSTFIYYTHFGFFFISHSDRSSWF